jgi:hypothetical protein
MFGLYREIDLMNKLIPTKHSKITGVDCICTPELPNGQNGALLLGLIITMVILSALGAGIVYIFSSSTLNPISGNYAQRAYYNAEAGFRYVTALYRSGNTTEFNTYIDTPKTLSIPDGGTAKVTVTGLTTPYIPAKANYVSGSGSTLTLSPTSGTFPSPLGFFMKDGSSTVHRYTGLTTSGGNIVLTGISPSVTAGGSFTTKQQVMITSTGTSGGIWNVSRKVTYIWPLSTAGGNEVSADPFTAGVNPGSVNSNWNNPSAGSFVVATTSGNAALQLTNQYNLVCWPRTTFFSLISLKWGSNFANFGQSWSGNNKTLSYDAQVKMKIRPQTTSGGVTYEYYMAGMVYRLNLPVAGSLSNASMLGAAFLRGHNGTSGLNDIDYIVDGVVPGAVQDIPLIVLWKTSSGMCNMQWIAYKILSPTFDTGNHTLTTAGSPHYVIGATSRARADITVLSNDNGVTGIITGVSDTYSTFQDGENLLQLARQSSLSVQVDTPISATQIDYDHGENANHINVGMAAGDFIVGVSSGATATIQSVTTSGSWINGNARGTIYFVGTSVGTFSNNEWLQIYRPGTTPVATYRAGLSDVLTSSNMQDIKEWSTLVLRIEEKQATSGTFNGSYINNIQVYLGDTSAHGTPTGSPLDILRLGNSRWSNPVAAGDVQWPPDAGWSLVPLDATKDHYTLIQGWVMNTDASVASSFLLTGTAEEPNSIIQTNTFTTHGLTTFTQQELGLQVAGSGMATYGTYFDDFAVKLKGSGGYISPTQY